MKRILAAASAITALLLLAGCSLFPLPDATSTPRPVGTVAPDIRPFYGQRLVWKDCGGGFRCSKAVAPLDWSLPAAGGRVHLALIERPASGHRIGTLFMNPGGPGVSAVDFLRSSVTDFFDRSLLDAYDIVAWDPRGVGHSSAVDCYGTKKLDSVLFLDPNLPEGDPKLRSTVRSAYRDFGRACAAHSGALLAHVDTISTVQDLDMLRAANGDQKLDYFGFSYGTSIGAEYADRFPAHVHRMALDGAVDPSIDSFQQDLANTKAFGAALQSYLASCVGKSSCPFHGLTVGDATNTIARILVQLRESPLRASDGRLVNSSYLRTAINAALYDKGTWPYLTKAFTEILQGTTTTTVLLADSYVDRGPKGYTDNLFEAIYAIDCLDHPVTTDPAVLKRQGAQLDAADPLRIADNSNDLGDAACANWPLRPVGSPHRVHAVGSPPILVLGTTGDPATPYAWAQSLAHQLPRGVLLTLRGEGHTAYRNHVRCINDRVDAYFLRGAVPAAVTCR